MRYTAPRVNEVVDEKTQLRRLKKQLAEMEARQRENAASGGSVSGMDAAALAQLQAQNSQLSVLVSQMEVRHEAAARDIWRSK